tara:strand:- start:3018 stop:3374 length:357 start_codon:yes stop_codon:yes gene_type:complete
MTSTRNRNTPNDYKLEQLQNINYLENNLYLHSAYGRPNSECFPELYNPSKLSRDALANNSIDIESTLRGIGSSNLVNPCEIPIPNLKNLDFKPFFNRPHTVIMPYPMILDNNQRPLLD